MSGRPLAGLLVLDLGTRIGAPFCAGLLGELGADVVKVEDPDGGDFMRTIGPHVDGYSLAWAVEGRGRRSATCDLRTPTGQEMLRRLASRADVLVENFRPGTMEGWGLAPGDLDPRLVYVRISAFGQDGPYAQRPGLDRIGLAFGGLMHITGYPDRPPVRVGVTLSDYLTGVFAAEAAVAALYERDARGTGRGAVIDAPLYGSVMRIMEWTFAAEHRLGTVRDREGNRLATSAPLDNYVAADGVVVCIVAGSDANFRRLCDAMGEPGLFDEYPTLADRVNGPINDRVAAWVASLPGRAVEAACLAAGVPVATVNTATDIAADPHVAHRHDLIEVDDPVIGPTRQQAPYPRVVGDRARIPRGAPELGRHDDEVWMGIAGLSADELAAARAAGVVRA